MIYLKHLKVNSIIDSYSDYNVDSKLFTTEQCKSLIKYRKEKIESSYDYRHEYLSIRDKLSNKTFTIKMLQERIDYYKMVLTFRHENTLHGYRIPEDDREDDAENRWKLYSLVEQELLSYKTRFSKHTPTKEDKIIEELSLVKRPFSSLEDIDYKKWPKNKMQIILRLAKTNKLYAGKIGITDKEATIGDCIISYKNIYTNT